jgi:hypothetical protein
MTPSGTQAQTAVWKNFVGAVQGSLDGMYATGNKRRDSSLRIISPTRQPADETPVPGTIITAQKRRREGSAKSTISNRTALQDIDPVSTPTASRVEPDAATLPPVTEEIVQNMQNIAKYRKKTELLQKKEQKWDLIYEKRRARVSRLEEELDQLATSVDADSEDLKNIERQLHQSRMAREASDDKLRSLRGSLMAFQNNAKFAVVRLEDDLAQILSERGLLNDRFSDSEESEHETITSTKRPRTDTSSVERLPSPDPEAEKKRDAVVLLREKRALVQGIEADFENRSELYRDGLQRWQGLLTAGDFDMTRTELDVQWCRNYGNLGLDLWEAEIARSRAAVDVMRLNALPISYSQTSKFADDPEDAAGLEGEAERAMATLDHSKIEDWLRGIEEQRPTDQSIELGADDWDVQSLGFGESCSGIADGWVKIRLQRWDMIREQLWNETKGGMDGDSALPSGNFVIEVDPVASQNAAPVSQTALISEMQG